MRSTKKIRFRPQDKNPFDLNLKLSPLVIVKLQSKSMHKGPSYLIKYDIFSPVEDVVGV